MPNFFNILIKNSRHSVTENYLERLRAVATLDEYVIYSSDFLVRQLIERHGLNPANLYAHTFDYSTGILVPIFDRNGLSSNPTTIAVNYDERDGAGFFSTNNKIYTNISSSAINQNAWFMGCYNSGLKNLRIICDASGSNWTPVCELNARWIYSYPSILWGGDNNSQAPSTRRARASARLIASSNTASDLRLFENGKQVGYRSTLRNSIVSAANLVIGGSAVDATILQGRLCVFICHLNGGLTQELAASLDETVRQYLVYRQRNICED